MAKILVADDDVGICDSLKEFLQLNHHIVDTAFDGQSALEFLASAQHDAVVLDWEFPDMSGPDVCMEYRRRGGQIPILILTARGAADDRVAGLEAGADDYLTKPFHPPELAARLKALLRRPVQLAAEQITVGSIHIDLKSRQVSVGGSPVVLRPMEFILLEFFARHPKEYFSAEALIERLWSAEESVSLDAVYTGIRRLRQKIDVPGQTTALRNQYGQGYILEP